MIDSWGLWERLNEAQGSDEDSEVAQQQRKLAGTQMALNYHHIYYGKGLNRAHLYGSLLLQGV